MCVMKACAYCDLVWARLFLCAKGEKNIMTETKKKKSYSSLSENIRKITYSAMLLAAALVLPFITGNIPQVGKMLCPMHIPVLLCGFICGWQWGLVVGFTAPLLRSVIFVMPVMYPDATGMAFELATYGMIAGIMYRLLPKKIGFIYIDLVTAMVAGRLVWGTARLIMAGLDPNTPFGLDLFWSGAITKAIPGIVTQLVLIPAIVYALERAGLVVNKKRK